MFEKLFENIGKKIKNIAVITFVIGVISSVIAGLDTIVDMKFLDGILIMVFGILCSWLSVVLLYGFGELIDKADTIEQQMGRLINLHIAPPKQGTTNAPATPVVTQSNTVDENAFNARQLPQTLPEQLKYALRFTSEEGMLRYLQTIQNDQVAAILQGPRYLIRSKIETLLNDIS